MAAAERVKMTTIEKLMVQIFEKKSRILEQVKQQTRLFDHHLASKLLIDGIAPPPWLLTSDLPSWTSDPAELNAEDLISEVLLSRQQRPAIPSSHSHCLVYEKPVAEVSTGQLPNGLCTEEVCAENKAFDEGDDPCCDVGCASVGVSTLDHCITIPQDKRDEDPSITSPQDQRDTRISDVNHDLALSLARLHRSKSRQRALELRNSAKVDKCQLEDDNNLSGCSRENNGPVVPFLQVDQPEEMDSVKPLETSGDNCVVEDANLGDTWNKQKGSRINSREATRFRSPGLRQSSLNVGDSSNVVREDDAMLMESVGLSIQQSNYWNQSLEPVSNLLIDNQNGRETESKVGNKRSKEKGSNTNFRRITRSKYSTEQNNHVTELFELDSSCNSQRESSTSSLTHQAQPFDRGENNKSTGIVEKVAILKRVTEDYSGRITRNRSSHLSSNTVYNLSKPVGLLPDQENLELCVVSGTEHSRKRDSAEGYISRSKGSQGEASFSNVDTHISAEKAFTIQEAKETFAANSTDVSGGQNKIDESFGRNTRTKPNFIAEVTSELVRSEGLGRKVTLFAPNSLPKQLETKNSSGRISCNVSSLGVKGLPCSSSQSADLEGCVATVMETEIVPIGPVEVHPICLGSNVNGNGFVGLEVLAICPADTSMYVEPKQLNFDDVQASSFSEAIAVKKENERLLEKSSSALSESAVVLDKATVDVKTSTFNGLSALAVEKENEGRLLDRSPPVLSEPSGILDRVMAENYQENYNVSLEETVDLSEEEGAPRDSSEVKEDDTSSTVIALEENVLSPAKETSHVEKNILAQNLQQSNKNSKARSSLTGNLVTTQAQRESMPVILLKEVTISNLSDLNAHTGMDPSVETETGIVTAAKPTELVPKVSELETLSVDRELSEDTHFPQVTKPDTYAEQEACTNHTVELPCAVSKYEAHANVNPDMFQSHTAEFLDRCGHEDTSIGRSQSAECQITAKSAAKASSIVDSWIRNKQKRSNSLDTLSNLPGTRENHVLSFNKDGESRNLLNEERSPRAILESKNFQVSQEDVAQSVIRGSQVEEMHQNHDTNVPENSTFSPKFQVETVEFSLEEGDRNANSLTTFANEEQHTSVVATEVRHAVGDCESHVEERKDADPTSTVYDGAWQCSLQENGNSYHHEEKIETENTECATNGESLMQEEISDLVGTSKFSCSAVGSPQSPSLHLTRADETVPVLERFIMQSDDEQPCNADEGISFDQLNLLNSVIERASILEQLCKSACMQTPASHSSPSYKLHKFSDLYQSVPTGLLEGMDMRDKLPVSEEVSRPSHARSHSDCLPSTTSYCDWDIKKPCLSPVRKVWDRIIKSGSSGKRRSLNPELPCINEENENMEEFAHTYQEGIVTEMLTSSVKREPLAEIDVNLAPSEAETYAGRFSLESVSTEFSFHGTQNKTKKKAGNGRSIQRRYNNKENETLGLTSIKGKSGSLHNRFRKPKLSAKTNSRKGGLSITETETKRSNIVSNITSFIPLVQQKQAPAVVTGKRDVKVKALEAAEAAKRAAEKKENERKLKKEAMKLERARQEQENLRQLELQKKMKGEERKKKEAEMAAKKRQREEEEKKEKERKRLRVEETRKQQKGQEQKLQAAKEVKNVKYRNTDEKGFEMRESKVEKKNYKMEKGKGDDNFPSISEAEPTTTRASTSDDRRAGIVHKEVEASSDVGNSLKGRVSLTNNLDKPTRAENLAATTRQEESYDISPYKCSDDEDEEDEDVPNGKFVPSWASKNRIALAVFSQDEVNPAAIFPAESFCSIAEVLLPRRFRLK